MIDKPSWTNSQNLKNSGVFTGCNTPPSPSKKLSSESSEPNKTDSSNSGNSPRSGIEKRQQRIRADLKQLCQKYRPELYGGGAEVKDTRILGELISEAFDYYAEPIIAVTHAALIDAKFHAEAAELDELGIIPLDEDLP
jgi:hypothetical protein